MGKKQLKEFGSRVLKSNNIVFTFLRSSMSSQVSSWVDMGTSFALFAWVHLTPFLSTAIGAAVGGIMNCTINYKFTYNGNGCSWRAVWVKYIMVWTGSMLLNSFGTQIVYYLLKGWEWLTTVGFTPEGCFAAARLSVSLIVSLFWNFLLQRHFVFRNTVFDPYAIRFVEFLKRPFKTKK